MIIELKNKDNKKAGCDIYVPREDSYLLKECVEKYAVGNVLEIGSGSGILAFAALGMASVDNVLAVDINPKAVSHIKKEVSKLSSNASSRIKVIKSDLFEKVSGEFDTIIFNPPYLPDDKRVKDLALDGGKNGYETIVRFLESVNNYLTQPGIVLLLFSSYSKKQKIDDAIVDNCLTSSLISELKLDFETLYVYRVEKSIVLRELEVNGITAVKRFARGKRGLIFKGKYGGIDVSIKSKNPMSESQNAMEREYKMIDFLRNEGFDNIPKVIMTGTDFFVYEYIDGILIEEFLKISKKSDIIKMIRNIMCSMRKLDLVRVNKEEMHRPHKHIIILENDFKIIDFERCKESEKPQNVTQFCQYITSENFNKIVARKKINFDKDEIMRLSKNYKKSYSEISFKKILDALK